MAFQTERIQIDGSLNVDGSIFQYGVEFTGGGGGGGTGDVAWASGSVGSNNQIITAAGDGSIVADPSITFSGTILQIGTQNQHATDSQIIIDRSDDGQAEIRFIGKDSDPGWTAGTGCTAGSMIPGNFYIHNLGFQNGPVFEIDTSENEIYNRVPLITQTGTGRDISEKVMAEDLVYAGASQLGDDHGFAAYSRQFGDEDYQYMYYRETNDYGGLFHRQGTSYSDLRQEFNYLDYYVGTTTGTNNKVFRFNTSGLAFGNSSNKVIKMDDMTEYDATPQSLSLIGAKGFGSASNYYTTSYNGTYSYYLYKGGEGGDVGIYGGDGADVSPTTSQPTSSPYNAFFGGDGGDVIINGGTKGSGWTQNEEEPGPADGNVVLDGTVVQVDSANFDVANNIRHIGDTETQIDFATNTIRLYAGSLSNEQLTVSGAGIILNEDGNSAYDFRVESDTNANMLFVDAGNNRVGVGNSASTSGYVLQVAGDILMSSSSPIISANGADNLQIGGGQDGGAGTGGNLYLYSQGGSGGSGDVIITPNSTAGTEGTLYVGGDNSNKYCTNMFFYAGSPTIERISLSSSALVINQDQTDFDFRVESNSWPYSLYMRGSDGKVGIGEMSSETEATYKMFNIRFNESGAKTSSVGQTADNADMFIYNDYTSVCRAAIDFAVDTEYPTTYSAGRFGFYGYGSTTTSDTYNNFFWTAGGNTGGAQWEVMRLTRFGKLHVRNDVVAYSTTITSDKRLKENIEDLDKDAIDKLMKLRPVSFEWKDKSKRGEERVAGLIAQEVEEVFPELVSETTNLDDGEGGEEESYKHIRYNELIPYLTKTVQVQQNKIDNQQKEIDDLKQKVELLLEKL